MDEKVKVNDYKYNTNEIFDYIICGTLYSSAIFKEIEKSHPIFKRFITQYFKENNKKNYYNENLYNIMINMLSRKVNKIYCKINGSAKQMINLKRFSFNNRHKNAIKYYPEYNKNGDDVLLLERLQFQSKFINDFIRKIDYRRDKCRKLWGEEVPNFVEDYDEISKQIGFIEEKSLYEMEKVCQDAINYFAQKQVDKDVLTKD